MASAVVREDEDYVHSVNKWLSAAYNHTEEAKEDEEEDSALFTDDLDAAFAADKERDEGYLREVTAMRKMKTFMKNAGFNDSFMYETCSDASDEPQENLFDDSTEFRESFAIYQKNMNEISADLARMEREDFANGIDPFGADFSGSESSDRPDGRSLFRKILADLEADSEDETGSIPRPADNASTDEEESSSADESVGESSRGSHNEEDTQDLYEGPSNDKDAGSSSGSSDNEEDLATFSAGPETEEDMGTFSSGPETDKELRTCSPGPETDKELRTSSSGPQTSKDLGTLSARSDPGSSSTTSDTDKDTGTFSSGPETDKELRTSSPGPQTNKDLGTFSAGPETEEDMGTFSSGPETDKELRTDKDTGTTISGPETDNELRTSSPGTNKDLGTLSACPEPGCSSTTSDTDKDTGNTSAGPETDNNLPSSSTSFDTDKNNGDYNAASETDHDIGTSSARPDTKSDLLKTGKANQTAEEARTSRKKWYAKYAAKKTGIKECGAQPDFTDSNLSEFNMGLIVIMWHPEEILRRISEPDFKIHKEKNWPEIAQFEREWPRYDPKGLRKKIIKRLLELGADINELEKRDGESLLMKSLRLHSRAVLGLILRDPWKDKLDLNLEHEDTEETALYFAIRWRLQSSSGVGGPLPLWFVRKLIELGSNLKHVNEEGYHPLDIAIACGDHECVELLFEMGAEITYEDGPVVMCAYSNDLEMTKVLLQAGASLDSEKYSCDSPLSVALSGGHIKLLELYFESGQSFDIRDDLVQEYCSESSVEKRFTEMLNARRASPMPLMQQTRCYLWKLFKERRVFRSKISELGLPPILVDYLRFV